MEQQMLQGPFAFQDKVQSKKYFTDVLKGHIAVATTNLNKINIGKKIDINARKFLRTKV